MLGLPRSLRDSYDTAILVTGDSDLVPAVESVFRLKPGKRIVPAFPPNRYSKELVDLTRIQPIKIWEPLLRKSRLPDVIKRDGLPDVTRPEKYSGKAGRTSATTAAINVPVK